MGQLDGGQVRVKWLANLIIGLLEPAAEVGFWLHLVHQLARQFAGSSQQTMRSSKLITNRKLSFSLQIALALGYSVS